MPLVEAKCTSCGANLKVDDSLETAVCEYCGTPYIVQNAINTTNNVYSINNSEVHIHNGLSVEEKLQNADVFFNKHRKKEKALEIYKEIIEIAPNDYRGWWGIVCVLTDNFSNILLDDVSMVVEAKKYFDGALAVANEKEKIEMKNRWDSWQKNRDRELYNNGKSTILNAISMFFMVISVMLVFLAWFLSKIFEKVEGVPYIPTYLYIISPICLVIGISIVIKSKKK